MIVMDAGGVALLSAGAGVLGAAVGAAGAIVQSIVGGNKQSQSVASQFRREGRRTAYANFINEVHAVVRTAKKATERVMAFDTADTGQRLQIITDVRQSLQHGTEQHQDLDVVLAAVILEGPDLVQNAAADVAESLTGWLGGLATWAHEAAEGLIASVDIPSPPANLEDLERCYYRAWRSFLKESRRAVYLDATR